MLRVRTFNSLITSSSIVFIVALLPVVVLVVGPSAKNDSKPLNQDRVLSPINLAILIQDDLVPNVSNELRTSRDFIRSLPEGSQVLVGYITSGSLQVRQPFTSDLAQAAGSLRITLSSSSASPFNPYIEVLEALPRFDSERKIGTFCCSYRTVSMCRPVLIQPRCFVRLTWIEQPLKQSGATC